MKQFLWAVVVVLMSVSLSHAFGENIAVSYTESEILQHKDNVYVEAGVKIHLINNGPSVRIKAIVKAVDLNGYDMAWAQIDDRIESMSNHFVTGRLIMKKMDFLNTDKWKIVEIKAYPSH